MRYRISTHAVTDLKRTYIQGAEQFGIPQAVSYHAKLEATFQLIADNPHMARERHEIRPPVRVHPCGAHMVIYEIDELGVLILRVRHHRENWIDDPS